MLSCTSLKASRTFLRSRAWSSFVSDTILARSSSTPSHLIVPLPPPQPRSMAETNESKRPTLMQYNGQMQPRRKVERDQIDDERRNQLPLVTNSRKETGVPIRAPKTTPTTLTLCDRVRLGPAEGLRTPCVRGRKFGDQSVPPP